MNFIEIQGLAVNVEAIDCVSPIERDEDGYQCYVLTLRSGTFHIIPFSNKEAAEKSRAALLKRLTHFRVDTL